MNTTTTLSRETATTVRRAANAAVQHMIANCIIPASLRETARAAAAEVPFVGAEIDLFVDSVVASWQAAGLRVS